MLRLITILLIISTNAWSESCDDLKDSGDGVPTTYFQEKCYAEAAFQKGSYTSAAKHFENASAVRILDAPNYSLRLEWGYSLCLDGNFVRGRELIENYMLMARADLGEFSCPTDTDDMIEAIQEEHMEMICIGYGSSLSQEGRLVVSKKLKSATEKLESCNDS